MERYSRAARRRKGSRSVQLCDVGYSFNFFLSIRERRGSGLVGEEVEVKEKER